MKVSTDRVLYLARVLANKLKNDRNLRQRADEETVRRAIARELTESYQDLEAIEQKVEASLTKRKKISAKDKEFLFARSVEEELRKRGA